MLDDVILNLTKEGILMVILASAPAIIASLIVGLGIAIFSATTQIQEQTLSFAPKMIVVYLALLACGAPLGSMLINYTKTCFHLITKL